MPTGKYKRSKEIKDNLSKIMKANPRQRCERCGAFLNKELKCSRDHSSMDYIRFHKRNCDHCGQYYEGRGEKYCSNDCQGKAFSSKFHWNWNGGKQIDYLGYVLIHKPNHPMCDRHGYIREHRLAMEEKLGRILDKKETVHHLDGNRMNNSIDNLYLFNNVGDHSRYHFLLRRFIKEALADGIN